MNHKYKILVFFVIVFFLLGFFNLETKNYISDLPVSDSGLDLFELESIIRGDITQNPNIESTNIRAIQKPGQERFLTNKADITPEELADQISSSIFSATASTADIFSGPILSDNLKQIEIEALGNNYSSQQISRENVQFDTAGNISFINHNFFLQVSNSDIALFESQIINIVEDHSNLFGLGDNGSIQNTSTLCAVSICVTTVEKSFYDLPAWDHELKISSSGNRIFSISGNFNTPPLPPPPSFDIDEGLITEKISNYFDVTSSSISSLNSTQLGINHLNGLDSYSLKYSGVEINELFYDIYLDVYTTEIVKVIPLALDIEAIGRTLNDELYTFSAEASEDGYIMVDDRFPADTMTLVVNWIEELSEFRFYLNQVDPLNPDYWPHQNVTALKFIDETISFFKNYLGYDAPSPNGQPLLTFMDIPRATAYWRSDQGSINFGIGDGRIFIDSLTMAAERDVVAHELTHGVISNTSNLEYKNQSGALNESFADIFGSLVDGNWLMGEDITYELPLRNLASPHDSISDQPAHMSEYVSTDSDNGGVHINSGIPNRAFYLLASQIGNDAAAELAFGTMISLSRTASFNDAANTMISLAKNNYGDGSFEHTATIDAWDSVGLPEFYGDSPIQVISGNSSEVTLVTSLIPKQEQIQNLPPWEQEFAIAIQSFYNDDPKFEEDSFRIIPTGDFSQWTRPSVISSPGDSVEHVDLIIYRRIDGSWWLYNLQAEKEIAITPANSPVNNFATDHATGDVAFSLNGSGGPLIGVLDRETDTTTFYNIYTPSTSSDGVMEQALSVDSLTYDPTGRYIVYDFLSCNEDPDCGNPFWSIGILDTSTGDFSYPISQPSWISIGNPSFSNETDRYITFDLITSNSDGTASLIGNFDRYNNLFTWLVDQDDRPSNGSWAFPRFSSDDSSIVYTKTFEIGTSEDIANTVGNTIGVVLLDGYTRSSIENPFPTIIPYYSSLPYSTKIWVEKPSPSLRLDNDSLFFGDILKGERKTMGVCLENESPFVLEIYDTAPPTGVTWNGDNSSILPGIISCSPVTINTADLDVGTRISTTLEINHNGNNSPTPFSIIATVYTDFDADGLYDHEDADGDGLTNAEEITLGTSPLLADSDGDGFVDGFEVNEGTDPLDKNSFTGSDMPKKNKLLSIILLNE